MLELIKNVPPERVQAVRDGMTQHTKEQVPHLKNGDIIGIELDTRVWEDITLTFWRNGVKYACALGVCVRLTPND